MRAILILVALFVSSLGWATDLLLFVRASEAGPIVGEDMISHPIWALWPHSSSDDPEIRLLSLPSGVDWQAGTVGLNNRDAWQARGYFDAVQRNLEVRKVVALRDQGGQVAPAVQAATYAESWRTSLGAVATTWPADAIVVGLARGPNPWDEVAYLVRKAGGRAMIVEIPEFATQKWTRVWLRGKGWPEGVPVSDGVRVAGLIPAREVMRILADPTSHKWQPPSAEPPNRWLAYGHEIAPVALVFLSVAAIYVVGLAVYCAFREKFSRFALFLIRLLILWPAAIVLGGAFTRILGIGSWFWANLGALFALAIAAWCLNMLARKLPDVHPLWGEFVVGLLACAAVDPVWSLFSQVLGPHRAPISPEAFGALGGYAVGTSYLFTSNLAWRRWFGFIALFQVIQLIGLSRWAIPAYLGVVLMPMVVLNKPWAMRLRTILLAVIGIGLVSAFWLPGLAYAPNHLVYYLHQVGKFNCAEQISFLTSPMFISFVLVGVVLFIAGDSFLGHQIRRAMSFSPEPKSMFAAAACFAVGGLFIPLFLHAALATAVFGGIAVLFDAVRCP